MTSMRNFPPTPSVEHLTTIFRRIESGKMIAPAFQRTFVWERENVLELLRSVYNGYPIGSVLLWTADNELLKANDSSTVPFPKGPAVFPVSYVLDGLQRLSSLYGVFHYGDRTTETLFDVIFDMHSRNFFHADEKPATAIPVPLNAVFNSRRLLDVQRNLLDQGLGDENLSLLTDLHARFQEYMIPLVTLGERSLEEVVVIFERVNSTGTKLSRVDFMRAITWSNEFDLNKAIDQIRNEIDVPGFSITDDTVVKALGLIFNLDPKPDVLLDLRRRSSDELWAGASETASVFLKAIDFFQSEIKIFSSDLIPYEGQMLVMFKVFKDFSQLNAAQSAALRAWFFYTSFEEILQGRPDDFVARTIKLVTSQLRSNRIDLPTNALDSERFIRRRMLKGKAITSAFVTMMANLRPTSLDSALEISPAQLTSSYSTRNFVPILNQAEISNVRSQLLSPRTPANVLIVDPSNTSIRERNVKERILDLASSTEGQSMLDRQLIPADAVAALASHDHERFLRLRAELIASRASLAMTAL